MSHREVGGFVIKYLWEATAAWGREEECPLPGALSSPLLPPPPSLCSPSPFQSSQSHTFLVMCRNGAVCRCLTKKLKGVWEQRAHSMLWSGKESTDLCPHSCSLCMSPEAAWKSGGADSASSCPPQESRRGKKSGNRLLLSTLLCGSQ